MDAAQLTTLSKQVKAITRPAPPLLVYYALSALLSTIAFPVVMVVLYFRYHTLWYRFDDQGVSMGYGVFFRRELQLTYARMQDIHLSQNLLERWLGIGTVTVQTAGSGAGGNLTIAGVREFELVRDYLYARMRGVRPDDSPTTATSSDALLIEIRDSLKAATAALEARRSAS